MENKPYGLFEVTGIEIEYMIVSKDDLRVLPYADRILQNGISELQRGPVTISNELVSHVIELKTTVPVTSLAGLETDFRDCIYFIQSELKPHGAMLLGTGMHPIMNPEYETVLWPEENSEIYVQFDRIFNCQGHGWANLQSMHINLPFADEEEFIKLHKAIRLILPLLPAMCASSPVVEGRPGPGMDSRVHYYRYNCARIPEISGAVIPEDIESTDQYYKEILYPIYRALEPLDPEKVLQEEWVNARGAIARFDRKSIEIRLMDTQAKPEDDLILARFVVSLLKYIIYSGEIDIAKIYRTELLVKTLWRTVHSAEKAVLPAEYLSIFGLYESVSASNLLNHLVVILADEQAQQYFAKGSLAGRIMDKVQQRGGLSKEASSANRKILRNIYRDIAGELQ